MNSNEQKVAEYLQKKRGFRVIRRGWPDFLCVRQEYNKITKSYTGRFSGIVAVEVKAGKDRLSEDQAIVHAVLKLAGIPTYVLKPEQIPDRPKLGAGHLRIWTKQDFDGLNNHLASLERSLAELTELWPKQVADLREKIEAATVMFEETNYLLDTQSGEDVVLEQIEGGS